ncbi:FAD-dependent oxidoreductase [Gulosibacter chungangensis]|uniref:Methyltransferase domain-containing protein n=1 Tax=Gulosibacter chungangensis TaxID=979746 RepID=A0A7J5BDW4_9MICO|nr:FAD-dependent oxidoreductase [Gulosibacter chungangensis]KAB1643478.1 methyltransferase domain-containing protein [Gulosibacter chungangensis]
MTTLQWDAIIIGGGFAGLSAAQTLGRSRRRTLVLDSGRPRNRFSEHAHNILGLDGTPPADLLASARQQAAEYGIEFVAAEVSEVTVLDQGIRILATDGRAFEARTLLVATGLTDVLPEIPGLAARWGKSVLHCPYCHGWEVADQRLGVLVLSEIGFHQAQLIRQWSEDLTVFLGEGMHIPADIRSRLEVRGVRIIPSPITELLGEGTQLNAVRTADGTQIPLDALFLLGKIQPNDGFLGALQLARTETPMGSFISIDETGRTSVERIWATGNAVNPGAAIPQAAGDAAFAAAQMNLWLVNDDTDRALADADASWPEIAPAEYWDDRYSQQAAMWSGRPNAALVSVVGDLTPGTALDLGCGEGADVLWLAQQGWDALGLDISTVAVERATAAADALVEISGRAQFRQADLSELVAFEGLATFEGSARFDLVTASFLHSTVELPRAEILRRASGLVDEGGHLLIITHAAPPPWFAGGEQRENYHSGEGHHHSFLTPQEEIEALALDCAAWRVVLAETRTRAAKDPDGNSAVLEDGVVLLQRKSQ